MGSPAVASRPHVGRALLCLTPTPLTLCVCCLVSTPRAEVHRHPPHTVPDFQHHLVATPTTHFIFTPSFQQILSHFFYLPWLFLDWASGWHSFSSSNCACALHKTRFFLFLQNTKLQVQTSYSHFMAPLTPALPVVYIAQNQSQRESS
jgi:hypothetical protein